MTPTLPDVLPRLTVLGTEAPLLGGLLSLQAAVMPPPPLDEPPADGLLLLLEPQAERLSAAATPRVAIEAVVLRIRLRLSGPAVRRGRRRTGLCFVREHIGKTSARLETFIKSSPACHVRLVPAELPAPDRKAPTIGVTAQEQHRAVYLRRRLDKPARTG